MAGSQARHGSSKGQGVSSHPLLERDSPAQGTLPAPELFAVALPTAPKAKPGNPRNRHLHWMPTCLGTWEGDSCLDWGAPPGPLMGFLPRMLMGISNQLRDSLGATVACLPVISELPQRLSLIQRRYVRTSAYWQGLNREMNQHGQVEETWTSEGHGRALSPCLHHH